MQMGILRGLLLIGAGIYTGIYLAQTYKIPHLDKPEEMWQRARDWLDKLDRELEKKQQQQKRDKKVD